MLKSALFWTAFPFVIPQALWVKKRAPRFADADGGTRGVLGEGQGTKVFALGDSIIAGVGAGHVNTSWMGHTVHHMHSSTQSSIHWSRLYQTGAKISEINQMYLSSPSETHEVILISVGVNDVTGLTPLKHWRNQLKLMIDALRTNSPEALIVFSGLPPMGVFPLLPHPLRYLLGLRAESLDLELQRTVSQYNNIIHMPIEIDMDPKNFSEDGYHPSAYGCQRWGEATAALIADHL